MNEIIKPKQDPERIKELQLQFNALSEQAKKEGFTFFSTIYFLTSRDPNGFSSQNSTTINGLTMDEFTQFLESAIKAVLKR